MRVRAEFLVEKRSGRLEGLRLTKLGRSIRLALSAERAEDWRVMELTTAVIGGLRSKRGLDRPLRAAELSDAVEQVLVATGDPGAARRYAAVRAEFRARRRALGGIGAARSSAAPASELLGERRASYDDGPSRASRM